MDFIEAKTLSALLKTAAEEEHAVYDMRVKLSYVKHMPGHKNSKGEAAPWVIIDHDDGKVLSSHKTKEEAKSHLRDMKIHGSVKTAQDEEEEYDLIENLPYEDPAFEKIEEEEAYTEEQLMGQEEESVVSEEAIQSFFGASSDELAQQYVEEVGTVSDEDHWKTLKKELKITDFKELERQEELMKDLPEDIQAIRDKGVVTKEDVQSIDEKYWDKYKQVDLLKLLGISDKSYTALYNNEKDKILKDRQHRPYFEWWELISNEQTAAIHKLIDRFMPFIQDYIYEWLGTRVKELYLAKFQELYGDWQDPNDPDAVFKYIFKSVINQAFSLARRLKLKSESPFARRSSIIFHDNRIINYCDIYNINELVKYADHVINLEMDISIYA